MKRKSLVFLVIAIVIIVAVVFGIVYGGKKDREVVFNPEFSKYITAYTSGIISRKSPIKVRLLTEVAEKIVAADEMPEDIFDFDPAVKGTCYWLDDNTIEFKPDEDLPGNTSFYAEFNLKKLLEVPEDLEVFPFEFQTIKQSFDVSIEEQKTIDRKELKWQKAIGIVSTADAEETEDIKKILHAFQEGNELKIHWRTDVDGKLHYFEIDSISRKEKASEIVIEWNGEYIGVDRKGDMKLEIPAIGDFSFISYKIIHQPEQYLQLQFSDPLKENQDLLGLIYISDVSYLRYIIDDNIIKVFPPTRLKGDYNVNIETGVKNILGYKLKKPVTLDIVFEEIKPAVRFVTNGVILPNSPDGLVLPFEAVSLKAVDVRIIKIYENNITQFLQVNDFGGDYQLRRVGKAVLKKTVDLDKSNVVDPGRWNRFSLDLNELIQTEPGAIYRITLGFRQKQSLYNCGGDEGDEDMQSIDDNLGALQDESEASYWNYYDDYYYGGYNWEHRDDPCHKSYYGARRSVSKNIIASDLGLIAKKGNDQSIIVFVTDIITARPLKDVTIELYDFQQQLLNSQVSDGEGIVNIPPVEEPYFVVAKYKDQRGYLRLYDGASLSLSRFDISGVSVTKGLKGFIYGERGVWRPGDSLYVTFILEENAEKLPENHPIIFELRNPQAQLIYRFVQYKKPDNIYNFRFKTDQDALTGNWNVKISVGGVNFTEILKIETIKPNRLKINFDFGREYLTVSDPATANMNVKWLHGAVAKDLKAQVDVVLSASRTYFEKYKDFTFDDPGKKFYAEQSTIYDGRIDENGNAMITADLYTEESAPGKLKATFITKVFEKGGNFSIDQFSLPYYPYDSYTGIKLPKGDKARGMLLTDTSHTVEIVTVSSDGTLEKASHSVEMEFYKISWRWWWDQSDDDLTSYSARSYFQPISNATIQTKGGKGKWKIRINYPDWGRYLVKARDLESGHSTAKIVYVDWPGWAGREQKDHPGGATMLTFTADKEKYIIDEKVNLTIPSGNGGRALVCIESGTKVIDSYWLDTQQEETKFSFIATKEMTPNVYVNVTILQPHAQTANDLPIRLYGIIPLYVEDPGTHLEPVIDMPDVLRPEEKVEIKVKEKNNKTMAYTIAIVDEGLLDLTRFKTPDPWNHFYAKEALGVRTWDIYDWVIGAYGGELERLLSIGGDGEGGEKGGKKAERFKPMVKFLGPFHLKGGKENKHIVEIPRYIGSVRTMVVAEYERSYGSAEKTTPVRKPLMVLGTLPRVLGPGEKVKLPVTIFAMEKNIKNVSVQVKINNLLKFTGSNKKSLTFSETGEQTIDFDLKVQSGIGIAKVVIVAASGKEKATYEIELDVRNPNPKITDFVAKVMEAGETWNNEFTPIGIAGTNKGVLEVSSIPPLNLEERLKYLIRYPHGCIEQTTSGAFPQLYLDKMVELNETKKKDITRNIKYAIKRLSSFQLSNGGFGYWPGSYDVSIWGTNYAGHFLIEAQKAGYTVPSGVIKKWVKYQKRKAVNWTDDGRRSCFIQAYRLYTLALADKAEIGAMNRLRGKSHLTSDTKWRLAAAYYMAGKTKIAEKLVENLTTDVRDYIEMSYTYGSTVRDKAMILETLSIMGKKKKAFSLLKEISESLAGRNWYSTQATAYSLIAVARYIEKNVLSGKLEYSYQINSGKMQNIISRKSVSQVDIPIKGADNGTLVIKNTSDGVLYARLVLEGIPGVGETTDSENDLRMKVSYKLMDGTVINPENIEQGTDFMAEVIVTHPGIRGRYEQIALTQIFPSGWEIINTRMLECGNFVEASIPTYQDIRDDRVYTYFDINRGRTQTYRVLLNASYVGRYYLPTVYAEAMYDNTVNARRHGKWVEVVRPGGQ